MDPDEVEALVNTPLEQPLWATAPQGGATESESEPQEEAQLAMSVAAA